MCLSINPGNELCFSSLCCITNKGRYLQIRGIAAVFTAATYIFNSVLHSHNKITSVRVSNQVDFYESSVKLSIYPTSQKTLLCRGFIETWPLKTIFLII